MRRDGDDDRLLLGLRWSFASRTVRMLGLPVLSHGLRLVGDHVAPLVGAKHAGTIVHADMCVHGARVVHVVSTVWTEDLLY